MLPHYDEAMHATQFIVSSAAADSSSGIERCCLPPLSAEGAVQHVSSRIDAKCDNDRPIRRSAVSSYQRSVDSSPGFRFEITARSDAARPDLVQTVRGGD